MTEENLIELLSRHVGPGDVPFNTYGKFGQIEGLALNVIDLVEYMIDGYDLYQYRVEYSPRNESDEEPPPTWVHINRVAEIKNLSKITIGKGCTNGELECGKFVGGIYVNPNETLDFWFAIINDPGSMYQRLSIIKDVLDYEEPDTVKEMFGKSALLETSYSPTGRVKNIPFQNFVEDSLKAENLIVPREVVDWRIDIDFLVKYYGNKRQAAYSPEIQSSF